MTYTSGEHIFPALHGFLLARRFVGLTNIRAETLPPHSGEWPTFHGHTEMNTTHARTARCFLLILSILCAGTSPPPRAAARARARGPAVGGGARFRLRQRKSPPKITDPQAPKIDAQTKTIGPFGVREDEGEARREFALSSPCGPHLFRLSSSSEKFFRFEQSANNVELSNIPRTLTIIIAPAAVSEGLFTTRDFDVRVTIECLDCANDTSCTQTRSVLLARVIVYKRKPHPSPSPQHDPNSPRASGQGSDAEAEELSKTGPQFADTFDLNDFKFKALLNNGWWLDFVYTLTQPGTVTVTVFVDGLPVLVQDFRMNAGWHEELIRLPNPSGNLGVATYSIKAVTDEPPAAEVIPFTVLSMAAGELASASALGDRLDFPPTDAAPLRGAHLTNAVYGFDAAPHASGAAPRGINVPLGLERVTFAPRDIRLLQGRPSAKATYSFRATRTFSGGARADIRLTEGGTSTLVGGDLYEGRLEAGQTMNGVWDCTSRGSPSVGRHVLFVKAWFTLQAGGNWSFVHSSPVVVRR